MPIQANAHRAKVVPRISGVQIRFDATNRPGVPSHEAAKAGIHERNDPGFGRTIPANDNGATAQCNALRGQVPTRSTRSIQTLLAQSEPPELTVRRMVAEGVDPHRCAAGTTANLERSTSGHDPILAALPKLAL